MSQITITGLSFSYYPHYHKVFHNVTLNLDTDWKLGVIGRNGRGKTTFLKLISGDLLPEAGYIEKQVNVEYFPYNYTGDYNNTLDIIMECAGGFRTMEKELDHPEVLQKYMDLEGFSMEGKVKREIKRMGLEEELLARDFETLSGGEQTKVMLISLFVKQNTFILLDEPTNHLDGKGRKEIADYLKKKKGFMVVSHDREFIDKVADHILALNKSDIKVEKGNYSTWKNNKNLTEEYEFRTKKNIGREIKRLERHAVKKRGWALVSNTQKYPFASHARTNGVRAYFRQAKRADILIERDIRKKKSLLLNYEEVKNLEFHQGTVEGEWLIKVENLSYSYTPHRVILHDISVVINQGDAVWIKGPNGSGKTTLLKLISRDISAPCIQYGADVEFSFLNQDLHFEDQVTGDDFLKEGEVSESQYEESLKLCDMFDITAEELNKPCNLFSSGEQKKLVLAKLLCQKKPVIILDEPLNYMDVMFREQLEKAIIQMKPTIIFVEHDVRFGERVANKRIELG